MTLADWLLAAIVLGQIALAAGNYWLWPIRIVMKQIPQSFRSSQKYPPAAAFTDRLGGERDPRQRQFNPIWCDSRHNEEMNCRACCGGAPKPITANQLPAMRLAMVFSEIKLSVLR
jgi:hypothetical protein